MKTNARAWQITFSVLIGMVVGIFFHYLLWRFSLPGHPFIYAAF
jgi:ABC-type Fe3+ transport system permease subunit